MFKVAMLLLLAAYASEGSQASRASLNSSDPAFEEWNRTFGGPYGDGVWSLQETRDGSYLLAGYTSTRGEGSDLWLIKTDSEGRSIWNRVFGGSGEDVGYFIQNTRDGGAIIVGSTSSYGVGNERLWLLKVDSNGSKQWDKTFGGFVSSSGDGGWSVNSTDDGGYIITGYARSIGNGGKDLWLIKADSAGNKQWDRTFGGSKDDVGMSVIQSADGGYVVAGRTASYGSGKDDMWLLKTDSLGREKWNRTFGGAKDDVAFQVLEANGGYVLVGRTESGFVDKRAVLVRTDLRGLRIWEKTYRGGSAGISVQKLSDGGFIISGNFELPDSDRDAILIKTDSSGREEWTHILGGPGEEIGCFALQCRDGRYLLAGITDSYGAGAEDAWLVKLHPIDIHQGAEVNLQMETGEADGVEGPAASIDTNMTAPQNSTELKGETPNRDSPEAQNIFKQRKQILPDALSGKNFGYQPLRPLSQADLLRLTGQPA